MEPADIKKAPRSYKWNFAIGTTSRVPGCEGLHYLILDIDTKEHPASAIAELMELGCHTRVLPTEHGWHIFTDMILDLFNAAKMARIFGADEKWVELALQRGYFFLADKKGVNLSWPVERMVIWRGKGKTQDTDRT